MPKISVIMPVYNGEEFLRETMDSILNQTFSDFEFIIINDASKDSTEDIIKSYGDDRIVYLINEQSLGVAGSLNRGLEVAKGEYIARIDADDIAFPERFEKQVKYMDEHKDCIMCGSNTILFGAQQGRTYVPCSDAEIRANLLFASPFTHPTVMMRRSFVEEHNLGYNLECEGFEDYNMWFDFAKVGKGSFYNFQEPLLRYRIHPHQVTQKPLSPERKEAEKQLRLRVVEYLTGEKDERVPEILSRKDDLKYDMIVDLYDACRDLLKKCDVKYHSLIISAVSAIGTRAYGSISGRMLLNLLKNYNDICARSFEQKAHISIMILKKAFAGTKTKILEKISQIKNRVRLRNKEFTIISNNCWGGLISQKYGLPYRSPTCGLLICGSDYIKFCANIKHYLAQELEFIEFSEGKYSKGFEGMNFPVAKLDDIEVYFMHYHSKEEAAEKWNRRAKRINWNNMVYKISERETFTQEDMRNFAELPLENKLIFASQKYTDDTVVIDNINTYVGDETPVIEKYFDEAKYFNRLKSGR